MKRAHCVPVPISVPVGLSRLRPIRRVWPPPVLLEHAALNPRIEEQLRLRERVRELLPQARTPYSVHLRVRGAAGRETDVLLGTASKSGEAGEALAIIDWRSAPLAEVFFGFDEGEEYQVDVEGRPVEGVLLQKNVVAFEGGELAEIVTPRERLVLRQGRWVSEPLAALPALHTPGTHRAAGSIADIQLDAAQKRIVELPPGQAALVLGEAGCGKTTVALHRLAWLSGLRGKHFKGAVVVPTEGLRAFTQALLERMNVSGVEALLYDRFAALQARKAFKDLPRRESQNTPAASVRLKRDAGLVPLLHEIARREPPPPDDARPSRRTRALGRREDLHALFGDPALLARAGVLGPPSIEDVVRHTKIQFGATAEEEFAHVHLEARQTADGRDLAEGTPQEDAQTVDVEDYAVLFEIDRLRSELHGVPPAAPPGWDCVVLDEAQELAPLELALIGRSVAPRGTLIVAGDADQQVDETASFRSWESTMEQLGRREYVRDVLAVSYRCPPDVTAFARSLREGGAPLREPAPYAQFSGEPQLLAWLLGELQLLLENDPTVSVAVICRAAETARHFSRALRFGLEARLALGGQFAFKPGVDVTAVEEVKGLEFDCVVLPDVTAVNYPDTAAARRALYVASTRAVRQLVMAGAGKRSALLG